MKDIKVTVNATNVLKMVIKLSIDRVCNDKWSFSKTALLYQTEF